MPQPYFPEKDKIQKKIKGGEAEAGTVEAPNVAIPSSPSRPPVDLSKNPEPTEAEASPQARIGELEEKLLQRQKELDQRGARILSLEQRLSEQKAALQALERATQQKALQTQESERKVWVERDRLALEAAAAAEREIRLQEHVKALTERLEKSREEFQEAFQEDRRRYGLQQEEIAAHWRKVLEMEREDREKEKRQLDAVIRGLQDDLRRRMEGVLSLESEREDYRQRWETVSEEAKSLHGRIEADARKNGEQWSVKNRLAEAERERAAAEGRIRELENELGQRQRVIEGQVVRTQELERRLTETGERLARAELQAGAVTQRDQDLRHAWNQERSELVARLEQLPQVETRLSQVQEALVASERRSAESARAVQALEREHRLATAALAQAVQDRIAMEKEVREWMDRFQHERALLKEVLKDNEVRHGRKLRHVEQVFAQLGDEYRRITGETAADLKKKSEEAAGLAAEREALQQGLQAAREHVARLESRLTEWEQVGQAHQALTAHAAQTDLELVKARASVQDVERRLSLNQAALAEHMRRSEELDRRSEEAQRLLAEAERALAAERDRLRLLEEDRQRLSEQLARSQSEEDRLQREMGQWTARFEEERGVLRRAFTEEREDHRAVQEQLAAHWRLVLEGERAAWLNEQGHLEQVIRALREEHASQSTALRAAEEQRERVEAQLMTAQSRGAELEREMAQWMTVGESHARLGAALETLREERDRLAKDVEEYQRKLDEVQSGVAERTQRIRELDKRLEESGEALTAAQRRIVEVTAQAEEAERRWTMERNALVKKIEGLDGVVAQLEGYLGEARAAAADTLRLKSLESELSTITEERDRLREMVESHQHRALTAHQERLAMRKLLAEMEEGYQRRLEDAEESAVHEAIRLQRASEEQMKAWEKQLAEQERLLTEKERVIAHLQPEVTFLRQTNEAQGKVLQQERQQLYQGLLQIQQQHFDERLKIVNRYEAQVDQLRQEFAAQLSRKEAASLAIHEADQRALEEAKAQLSHVKARLEAADQELAKQRWSPA